MNLARMTWRCFIRRKGVTQQICRYVNRGKRPIRLQRMSIPVNNNPLLNGVNYTDASQLPAIL